MVVLEFIAEQFNNLRDLGSAVMVPIMFIVVALVFGLKITQAFKVGLTIGIGFIGLNLAIGLIWTFITPAAEVLLERFGLEMSYVDGGWMTGAAIGFASPVGLFIIPFALLVNAIMLMVRQTKTLNVDVWNFWHFAFYGGIVYAATGNVIWGYVTAGVMAVLSLKFGDMGAKYIEKEMGIPGISVPQNFAASTIPLGLALDKLYDKIPGLNKLNVNPDSMSKRLGIFGEPATIGFFLGLILGIAAGYNFQGVMEVSIGTAAMLLILPRMIKILMEALIPLSEAAKAFMQKRFKGRDFYVGLDSAILLANPTTMVVGVLLIPITLMVALLPFNIVLPAGDLSAGAFYVAMFSLIHRNNFVRTILSGTILMVLVYAMMTFFAPLINELAIAAGFVEAGAAMGISAGLNPAGGLMVLFPHVLGGHVGGAVMLVVAVVIVLLASLYIKRTENKVLD